MLFFKNTERTLLFFLTGLTVCYGFFFISQTSFLLGNERVFCLFDDAMISMRYADNLAEGNGPVWNAFQKVEGITNPLWTCLMALFHQLPLSAFKISFLVQLSGLLFLVLSSVTSFYLSSLFNPGMLSIKTGSFLLTSLYYPFIYWTLGGMETGAVTFCVLLAYFSALKNRNTSRFNPLPYWILGFGTLIRFDVLIPLLSLALFNLLTDSEHRKMHLKTSALTVFLFIGGQTLARYLYYGELLPNTYYLKVTGADLTLRLSRGFYILSQFIRNFNLLLFFISLFWLFARGGKKGQLGLFLIFGQLAYSVYVGGDAWERGDANRYLLPVMPILFIGLLHSLFHFIEELSRFEKLKILFKGLTLTVLLIRINAFQTDALKEFLFLTPPYETAENKNQVEYALLIDSITTPKAKVGVSRAGVLPYFLNRECIDFLGKSDTRIARLPAHIFSEKTGPLHRFYPGHMKWDYKYSIQTLKPDVIATFWLFDKSPQEAFKAMKDDYVRVRWPNQNYSLLLRKGSPHIRWEGEMINAGIRQSP